MKTTMVVSGKGSQDWWAESSDGRWRCLHGCSRAERNPVIMWQKCERGSESCGLWPRVSSSGMKSSPPASRRAAGSQPPWLTGTNITPFPASRWAGKGALERLRVSSGWVFFFSFLVFSLPLSERRENRASVSLSKQTNQKAFSWKGHVQADERAAGSSCLSAQADERLEILAFAGLLHLCGNLYSALTRAAVMNIDASVQTLLGDIWTFCRARMESKNKKKSLCILNHQCPQKNGRSSSSPVLHLCFLTNYCD